MVGFSPQARHCLHLVLAQSCSRVFRAAAAADRGDPEAASRQRRGAKRWSECVGLDAGDAFRVDEIEGNEGTKGTRKIDVLKDDGPGDNPGADVQCVLSLTTAQWDRIMDWWIAQLAEKRRIARSGNSSTQHW